MAYCNLLHTKCLHLVACFVFRKSQQIEISLSNCADPNSKAGFILVFEMPEIWRTYLTLSSAAEIFPKIFILLNPFFARLRCWKKFLEYTIPPCWINSCFAVDTDLNISALWKKSFLDVRCAISVDVFDIFILDFFNWKLSTLIKIL